MKANLNIQTFKEFRAYRPLKDVINENLTYYTSRLLNFTITGYKNYYKDDNEFSRINYTYSDGKNTFNVTDLWTKTPDTIYRITYQADPSNYYTYWQAIQKMIDSFKSIDSVPYENFDLGIRIKYPSTWNKTEDTKESHSFSPLQREFISSRYLSLK